ncbi:hypothetical protein TBLA_0E02480 [Henningerozyma blattae CBS 6284]|uniref:Calcineurin-like phosphoesterase domain-containing protein n=1 Tax=Henningerozyma blattae (strain ATCC 34711 / CBS 6284 / DSM 70876 / NBRC 10599 / NRRL Y-10934 / UCD 77-7) TaxID=1071380 RepID=I2H4K0_HENB6|nr:hypothetical protein TBLA_0E02480 [Tetrapisispora blattae CBS 6284]CCH61302.1 hypothetical protein TBLA_0E02480 [Tetrapisispora blattae CBS 6284]
MGLFIQRALFYLCIVGSLTTLISHFYIFTYPSTHANLCSWDHELEWDIPWQRDAALGQWHLKKWVHIGVNYVIDMIRSLGGASQWDKKTQLRMLAFGDPQIIGVNKHTTYRSGVDTFGNDFFLGHIFQLMQRRLNPTHVVILGDLISSQWVDDSEYFNRTRRYSQRIYNRKPSVLQRAFQESHDRQTGQYKSPVQWWKDNVGNNHQECSYKDVYTWDKSFENFLFVNVSGNHDVGYSGDTTYEMMSRYNHLYGKDNFWIEYQTQSKRAWRIVVLNSLALDGPCLHSEICDRTWEFLSELHLQGFNGSTILLTHVPLYKREGLCKDGPSMEYYDDGQDGVLLAEQNHLSQESSDRVLDLVFDNGKPGFILNGHDHWGCETVYSQMGDGNGWECDKSNTSARYVREATVKSVMGQYHGNSGLLRGDFNEERQEWEYEYSLCPFTREHPWWVAKVSLFLTVLGWSVYALVQMH